MSVERRGDTLVCRAGAGEWFNQPHDRPWDMGEDVAPLPPSAWHVEIEAAVEAQPTSLVVVDTSEMDWLVGQDLGFLMRLRERLAARRTRLSIVASDRVVRAIRGLGLPLDV